MSAGICGKRLGLEEVFGSPSSSNKRARFACFGSPVRHPDDHLAALLRMFPSMDRQVIETILKTHDNKIDDAIKSLNALCLGDISACNDTVHVTPADAPDNHATEDLPGSVNMQTAQQNEGASSDNLLELGTSVPESGSSWVDIFVQEMMKAANWDDVRGRATRILEAFEGNVMANCKASSEQEVASLQEQLQGLLRENQILKRAVAIQHERTSEQEEKLKEAQQLKQMISQYQEQVRTLELNNYTLKIHLQRAQDASSMPNQFHPDIF